MSNNNSAPVHDDTGPVKNPKQLLLTVFFSFVIPIFIIIGLVNFVTSDKKPEAGAVNLEQATESRIQKVGTIELRAAESKLPKTGEEVFKGQCTNCHTAGLLGAPKPGDTAAWGPRIKKGYEALLSAALKGKASMPPQGNGAFGELEIGRAVVYMANSAGGKLKEPKAPPATTEAAK